MNYYKVSYKLNDIPYTYHIYAYAFDAKEARKKVRDHYSWGRLKITRTELVHMTILF